MFKRNRLGKCGFRVSLVYVASQLGQKQNLIQKWCTKWCCWSAPCFSSTWGIECIQIADVKRVWWKEEGGISLFPLLLCFVMFCVCSVCLQDQRNDSESYFHNRKAWESTSIGLLKTHSSVYYALTWPYFLIFCMSYLTFSSRIPLGFYTLVLPFSL